MSTLGKWKHSHIPGESFGKKFNPSEFDPLGNVFLNQSGKRFELLWMKIS